MQLQMQLLMQLLMQLQMQLLMQLLIQSSVCCVVRVYSGSAELIEQHCDYLCNALSLNIRRLHRHPTCPAVLCSVLLYSQSTILPYIEQIILEVSQTFRGKTSSTVSKLLTDG